MDLNNVILLSRISIQKYWYSKYNVSFVIVANVIKFKKKIFISLLTSSLVMFFYSIHARIYFHVYSFSCYLGAINIIVIRYILKPNTFLALLIYVLLSFYKKVIADEDWYDIVATEEVAQKKENPTSSVYKFRSK